MPYRKPGVEVFVQENRRIINLGSEVKVPAIVGTGPTTLTAADEAIQHTSGSVDQLAHVPIPLSSVVLTNLPLTLAPSGSINYADNLYESGSDYTVTAAGAIAWTGSAGCVANPSMDDGDVYYANYTHDVEAVQFTPQTFVDSKDILATYGDEDVSTGILSIAGRMALENGAPAVILCQVSGSETAANYLTTINKLKKQHNIGYVSVVFSSGSMSLANMRVVHGYLKTHADQMSQPSVGLERGAMIGDSSDVYAVSDGIDIEGSTEISDYTARAQAIGSKQVIYVAPAYGTRTDKDGNVMELDANFAACAVAGLVTGQISEEIPVHGVQLVGYMIDDDRWSEFEMNQLGSKGCLTLYSHQSVVKVRDAITTDNTSAETEEISVVDIERRLKRSLRTGLTNAFVGRGLVVDEDTEDDVVGVAESVLKQLVRDGVIVSYGKTTNPDTGEVPIKASQDSSEPRLINLTCSYKPAFPLKYITATVNTYV